MLEQRPVFERSNTDIQSVLLSVQETVRRQLTFIEQTPYHETAFKRATEQSPKTAANCEAYAGLTAELVEENGLKAYIANCSYHLFTVAVDGNGGVHMLHSDHPGFSRFNLERPRSEEQKPLFFSEDTIAQLQSGVGIVTGDVYPQDLGIYDYEDGLRGFFTAPEWTKYRRKPVGLIAWPAGKDFLFTRSITRSTLGELANTDVYQPALLETLNDNLQTLQTIDVDCDRSAKGSYSKLVLRAVKNQGKIAPDIYALERLHATIDALLPINDLRAPFSTNGQKILKGDSLATLVEHYATLGDYCAARTAALDAQSLYLQAINLDGPISRPLEVKLGRIRQTLSAIETRSQ